VKRQQVALDLQEALEEFETTKTAAAKAEAASTSLLAEVRTPLLNQRRQCPPAHDTVRVLRQLRSLQAMLSLQQAENDEAKKEVAGLEQELSRLREKAHEQDERAIGECMRLDAEFRCVHWVSKLRNLELPSAAAHEQAPVAAR